MVYLLMGVSGAGKTAVGRRLAARLDVPFYDADDFHPPANVRKMQAGQPLDDEDRRPWLATLADHIRQWNRRRGAVLACSALKSDYRRTLSTDGDTAVQVIYLKGDQTLIAGRLADRRDHYMPADLLDSQFDALEEPRPSDALIVDIAPPPDAIVEAICDRLPPPTLPTEPLTLFPHTVWESPGSWRLAITAAGRPDARAAYKATVRHPGAVALIPITADDKVLMIRQYRQALGQHILEIPAGTRHWDEDWSVCAQRELREETGYRAETFHSLGYLWPAPGVSDEQILLYVAQGLTPDPLPADFDEQIELVPTPLDALVDEALNGRLPDAKTTIGLLRVHHWLNR